MQYTNSDIERFVEAQASAWSGYAVALGEISHGRKTSHWMWYIFPQLRCLGRSSTAKFYGIENRDEAATYLNHAILGPRLREICATLLHHRTKSAREIMGGVDATKLRSSMTLFDALSPNDIFGEVLDLFYAGERCQQTLRTIFNNNTNN